MTFSKSSYGRYHKKQKKLQLIKTFVCTLCFHLLNAAACIEQTKNRLKLLWVSISFSESLRENCSNTESGPYFPVFSPNTEKYGPEKTPYLDTFNAVSG